MIEKIDLNTNIFTEVNAVREICHPLQLLGISDFFFMRIYKDNSIVDLATHAEWGTHFFTQLFDHRYDKTEISNHFFPTSYVNLWEHYPDSIIWQEGKNHFNVGNGISILQKYDHYHETFSFFTDKLNFKLNDFYVNHLHLLEKFILYFKEKALHLIHKAESQKIKIPEYYCIKDALQKNEIDNSIKNFLNSINKNSPYCKFLQLSKRECECLYWMALGKTAEEIGIIFDCSKRTVEFHIKNAKEKTNTNKITTLIYQATKLGLIEVSG